ncbi:uncharacterized protein LOC112041409 [Lingula anatina]|uniref:Uncharacterized protein LOC112041409 n=1 Tax=Lingula anatina TaxID=7574 RepID=A0A2R2MJE8_LINAN|nr:uncharacterized protein LOC112041409 [Lingula anatina]|eukprot:XP_023930330.1 uncharacterized protein LOC112041409 [Lingula anatina]
MNSAIPVTLTMAVMERRRVKTKKRKKQMKAQGKPHRRLKAIKTKKEMKKKKKKKKTTKMMAKRMRRMSLRIRAKNRILRSRKGLIMTQRERRGILKNLTKSPKAKAKRQ